MGDGVNVLEALNVQGDMRRPLRWHNDIGVKGTPELQDWAAVGVQEHGMWKEIRAKRGRPLHLPGVSRGMRSNESERSKREQGSQTDS